MVGFMLHVCYHNLNKYAREKKVSELFLYLALTDLTLSEGHSSFVQLFTEFMLCIIYSQKQRSVK